MNILEDFERRQQKAALPEFEIGDTIDVHVRIVEGDKTRVQIFSGTAIGRRNKRNRGTFTVRRIVAGEGVERVFPLHSPWIEKVVVKRRGHVRRAKLYYLRDRVGKATKVREKIGAVEHARRKRGEAAAERAEAARVSDAEEASTASAVAGSAES